MMTALLLRRWTSLKAMRDQLVLQCIPALLQSKRRCEKRYELPDSHPLLEGVKLQTQLNHQKRVVALKNLVVVKENFLCRCSLTMILALTQLTFRGLGYGICQDAQCSLESLFQQYLKVKDHNSLLIFRSERERIFYVIILDPHLNHVEYDWSYNGSELITTPPTLGLKTAILPSVFWEWSYLVDFGHVSGKQYKEQIATLEKCEERYKTVFADKISEFRRACCELFGYKVFISTLLLVLL
ncbi:hypothetical protein RHGRI_007868 [Rhododendron griersonianum]|uniref:Uncharacterized protein n=1 Tax=Rhododendron griersonianum TaxID=479676 RepID=A0AAV6L0E4_9ERIC|nr:hypothetical protein RHGRI_007868 [Rhododendron griersonianum]